MTILLPGTEDLPTAIAFALSTKTTRRHWIEDAAGELWTYDPDTETAYRTHEIDVACDWCDGLGEIEIPTRYDPFASRTCRSCGGHGIASFIPDGEWITQMIAWAERRAPHAAERSAA